jgi:hypothetical protein
MKKFILGFIAGGVICATVTGFAVEYAVTANPYPVKVNGTETTIEGYNINDNTYFKLRDVANAVGGFEVGFSDNTITIDTGNVVKPELTVMPVSTVAPTVEPEPTSVASLPTPKPVGSDDVEIKKLDERTIDNIWIFKINDKKYVNATLISMEYDLKKYSIKEDATNGIYLQTNTNQIVFKHIPGLNFNGSPYIDLDYYESTLYPYLNQYCK